MSEQTVEIRFDVRDEASLQKIATILTDLQETEWIYCTFDEIFRSKGLSVKLSFMLGNEFELDLRKLYRFIAVHCDTTPLLRQYFGMDGRIAFMFSRDGIIEEQLLDKPLKGYSIAESGAGFAIASFDELEYAGATCHETLNEQVNLFVFDADGDVEQRQQALAMGIRVISEDAFNELHAGWHVYPPSSVPLEISESEQQRLRMINTLSDLTDYLQELEQPGGQEQHAGTTTEETISTQEIEKILNDLDAVQKKVRNPLWQFWYRLKQSLS